MVQVKVNEGLLEGEVVENPQGGVYCSFKGIPYAEPPIGNLRFKAPRPPQSWAGVRRATEHGPVCYQFDYLVKQTLVGSEDCLYLNVYTPNIKPDYPLPVMLWIHGGGFVSGDGNDDLYSPEFLVKQNVILVTINYRLEIFGFLCLNTKDIPGNAGMKDQVAAMRWVKKNIINFGGDSENITIFGESAGGVSVCYHLVSPMTKGLFRRAIIQSCTAFWWTLSLDPRERAISIAKKLGLNSRDDQELFEFFKRQPFESLANVHTFITFAEKGKASFEAQLWLVDEMEFGDNERFFHGDIIDSLHNGVHEGVEVIAGYCADEGILAIPRSNFDEKFDQINSFFETFVPKGVALNCSVKQQLDVGRRMRKFYFHEDEVSQTNIFRLAEFYTAEMFKIGTIHWQRISSRNNKVYLYEFNCKSDRNIFGKILGLESVIGSRTIVCHGDDLPYLFPMKALAPEFDQSSKSFNMIEKVVNLWANFAKYGDPTPDDILGVKWLPYTEEEENYLDINEELVARTAPDKEEYEFWVEIFKQFLPHYLKEKQ